MSENGDTVLIIFGITGDLSTRKLLPAVNSLADAGVLTADFRIIGITRSRNLDPATVTDKVKNGAFVKKHLQLFHLDNDLINDYLRLKKQLDELSSLRGTPSSRLYYLAVPPEVSRTIIRYLGESGLAAFPGTKILLEKPFGTDYRSAQELIALTDRFFDPDQVYRIDHFLAKETVQNLVVFRQTNSLFKSTWNHRFIDRIDILMSEDIGIEGRVGFYEQTGALRDVIQSHLLQLAALALMDLPANFAFTDIPKKRLAALKSLAPALNQARRGQYHGYRREVANPGTTVETFASITLASTSKNWQGVPVTLTAGKSLDRKRTEIKITYRPYDIREANLLIFRLQPDEGIELSLWAKKPGYAAQLECHTLHFRYSEHYSILPEAYEKVLLDAVNSDHTLFTSGEEILEAWRILSPVQKLWHENSHDLTTYPSGATPEQVISLFPV